MRDLTVCCVMLANGREAMVRRAIECYHKQTYPASRRFLLIFDTSPERLDIESGLGTSVAIGPVGQDLSIGALRNMANGLALNCWDLLMHWDSDDWSHPRRIEEQVELIASSGKECVGYRDMLFWRQPFINLHPGTAQLSGGAQVGASPSKPTERCDGEAWLYRGSRSTTCLGTSLCYWRRVWQARPFPDLPKPDPAGLVRTGEDFAWLAGVNSRGVPSLPIMNGDGTLSYHTEPTPTEPRMIAGIHEGNRKYYDLALKSRPEFERVPGWDDYARERMAL